MLRNRVRSRSRALSLFSDAALNINFVPISGASPSLDSRITFTRSSTATYINSAGVLSSAAINEARFDYDPATLAAKGLLIEEQRTNSIRNNTMQGAVAGTPGTLPTNWSVSLQAGVSSQVVGTGSESGINYIDLRFSGTPSATGGCFVNMETSTAIVALPSEVWAHSCYARLVSGSWGNIVTGSSTAFYLTPRDSAGATIAGSSTINYLATSSALISQRVSAQYTTPANTAYVSPYFRFGVTSGNPIDFTIRLGLPQVEKGAFATSVIPTTTAATTRAADVATITGMNFSSWYNQVEGTLYLQAQCISAVTSQTYLGIDNNSANNFICVRTSPSSTTSDRAQVTDGGVTQAALGASGYVATAINQYAFAYKTNDFARSINNSAISADASGTIPDVNQMFIGSERGSSILNGHILRISYYPSRLSNEKLKAITS